MYADDIKCFSRIDCLADVVAIQQNIDKLMSRPCDWQLCFIASKCNDAHSGNKICLCTIYSASKKYRCNVINMTSSLL